MVVSKTRSRETGVSIYVIAGKNRSLVNAERQKLLDELLEPPQRATGLFDAQADKVLISEVLDELRTAPFLTEKRVVVVKEAEKFISENRQLLEKYFDNPSPTGILILTVSNWDARTRLAKKLAKEGKLISVMQLKTWQLPSRLIRYAKEAHNKNLNKDDAELLVELSGDNLLRLYSEVDKLALLADTDKSITARNIESLIGHNRLFNAFAVIDAVMASKIAEGIARLRNMFAADRTAEYTVVGAFAFHFRRMFNAKALLEKGLRPNEVAGRLRIRPNKEGALFAQLRKVSLKQLGENLKGLAEMDYQIKTGRTKAQVAIEQLVLKLSADPGTV